MPLALRVPVNLYPESPILERWTEAVMCQRIEEKHLWLVRFEAIPLRTRTLGFTQDGDFPR
jgi:hypothetical protein